MDPSQLAALRSVRDATTDPAQRAALDAAIAALEAAAGTLLNLPGAQTGDITTGDVVSGNQIAGAQWIGDEATVGVAARDIHGGLHIGVLNLGRTTPADEPALSADDQLLLNRYLQALQTKYGHLLIGKRVAPERTGNDERPIPELYLEDVFTTLTTDGPLRVVEERELTAARLRKRLDELSEEPAGPDEVEPERVRLLDYRPVGGRGAGSKGRAARMDMLHGEAEPWRSGPLDGEISARAKFLVRERRPELAVEAMARRADGPPVRLVLLGGPGSGKSTVLRYVALLLAQARIADRAPRLHGWSDGARVPFFVPLGGLSAALDANDAVTAMIEALLAELRGAGELLPVEEVRRLLFGLLPHATLLLDGLDELSAEARPGQATDPRSRVIAAIRVIARDYPGTDIVVTSRSIPYRAPWVLPADEGWVTRTVQPFARGQVGWFVRRWYEAMARTGETGLTVDTVAAAADDLLGQLDGQLALAQAVAVADGAPGRWPPTSPLLVTMLAILHYNLGGERLPTERARIYEQLVVLLLHRWEPRRSAPFVARRDLVSRLKDPHDTRVDELPSLREAADLRVVLHEVAYATHRDAPAGESRGVIDGDKLFGELRRFFGQRHGCPEARAVDKAGVFLTALREEAGLLLPHGDHSYQFPHLTFQEYLAACHLAEHERGEELAYERWSGSDGDRWREVILLMMGCLRRQKLVTRVGKPWMTDWLLRDRSPRGPKSLCQTRRDALLAADCYEALGGRAALDPYSDEVEAGLRHRLAAALEPGPLCLPAPERVRAGMYLGELGDPRPGVCDLRLEMVEFAGGEFQIGVTEAEHEAIIEQERANNLADEAQLWYRSSLNAATTVVHPFWLARYSVTNAQYHLFVKDGYDSGASWWSEAGRKWLRQVRRTVPAYWNDPRFGFVRPNHPVVGVNWYEATAFCAWMTDHLKDGYVYCLPSEAEWEYAARGPLRRVYPWGNEEPDGERANYSGTFSGTSAVGCFPAGATAERIQDLAGNVWEWTRSEYRSYPYDPDDGRENMSDPEQKQFTLRGGSWASGPTSLRAANRDYDAPDDLVQFIGFRLVRRLPRM